MKTQHLTGLLLGGALFCLAANVHAQDKEPSAPEVDTDQMVEIEAGTFEMGTATDREVGDYGNAWQVNELPRHEVTVDDFRLDTHEVTVEEFALFLTYAGGQGYWNHDQYIDPVDDGFRPVEGAEDEPIRNVTWDAANDYCRWAGKRLPTEAEWEYAAAGEDRRRFPWGDDGRGCEAVNYFAGGTFCEEGVVEVDANPDDATPDGVEQMGGNVAEWTADWYDNYPDDAGPRDNPTGPDDGELKVVRGGSHLASGRWRRSRARRGAHPDRHSDDLGFRCAYDEEPSDSAVRGELSLPADSGREEIERPKADRAPLPAVAAEDLLSPGAVVAAAGQWYVLERGTGSIIAIDTEDLSTSTVVDDLDSPTDMATDGAMLFVTDEGSQQVLQIDPSSGDTSSLADDQVDAHSIEANEAGVVWALEDSIQYYDLEDDEHFAIAEDLDAPVDIAMAGADLYFTTDNEDAERSGLYTVEIAEGAEAEELLDAVDLVGEDAAGLLHLEHVALPDEGAMPYFILRYRGFPNNGLLFVRDVDEGTNGLLTYTPPPRGILLEMVGHDVFMSAGNTIITYDIDDGSPYSSNARAFHELTPWTRPGGLFANDEFVVWSDQPNGRVYFQERD
ncbi:MAG: SUMF1/EgtB/PvdO family nonheme iron enzyme [Persicimonas sp.]